MASFDEFNSSADYHSSWTEMDYCVSLFYRLKIINSVIFELVFPD